MSYLVNDPDTFSKEMIDGFVAVDGEIVQRVDGGVCRVAPTPRGQGAVVIGGGSAHYPAFAGLAGAGLAHGAAMGHVFASPSAHQVSEVARAVASDSGVLLSYGNCAGDVLNFDSAQEQLQADGIPTRTVVVTDDISSAGPDERELRRVVAGDLRVFRAAAWAAEEGRSLDGTWDVANRASERTRTLGVALSGYTLPGAAAPLFTVPVCGEDEDRVAAILNGLGSVKSEELFVVYGQVAKRLDAAGLTVVRPEVGEFARSFEMAGLSLTIMWLDDELERAWTSPTATAAYQRGAVVPPSTSTERPAQITTPAPSLTAETPRATADSRVAASRFADCVRSIERTVVDNVDRLGRLDAVAGDGDHGIGMHRGVTAAVATADAAVGAGAGARTTLAAAADAWAEHAGGTSGALWGLGLRATAERFSEDLPASAAGIVDGVAEARDAVMRVGGARLGDKTLLDALIPFSEHLAAGVAGGTPLPMAWMAAAKEATAAAESTADLLPRIGRARAHTQRSIGRPDPGAVSFALAVTAIGPLVSGREASA